MNLTLFHVTPIANLFYVGGFKVTPPSNFVIFEDRDLKFGDNLESKLLKAPCPIFD